MGGDIKGYDNATKFVAAAKAAGIDLSSGDFTVFAPVDSKVVDALSADQVKYHIVEGKVSYDAIATAPLKTLQGETLTYKRFARQSYVDDAIVGLADNFGGGSVYPTDVDAGNAVIHFIDAPLVPGWSAVGAETGAGGIANKFAPSSRFAGRTMRRTTVRANAVLDKLAETQGPHICWGSAGVPLGHDEGDIKGYDNATKFVEAAKAAGVDLSSGEFTVFAPVDSKIVDALTADQVKYHIVEGKVSYDALGTANLKTLQGETLTYKRFARQSYVDDAIVGLADNFGGGSVYPTDVQAANGVIHFIDSVLVPGWSAVGAETGAGGIANKFAPSFNGRRNMRRTAVRSQAVLDTLAETQGPHICWGSAGVLEGYDEGDIKGYDNATKFVEAVKAAGIDLSSGDYTIFAPVDSKVTGDFTADQLKYHIVEGKVSYDAIATTPLKTLQGETLTYKRFARQTYVDDAIVG